MKTNPRPTKFESDEDTFLQETAKKTGLSISEVIRRSVRLTRRHTKTIGSSNFLLELAA